MKLERKSVFNPNSKREVFHRLNKVEGQIRGIKRLVESNVKTDDVMTQIFSAQAALNGVAIQIIQIYLKTHFIQRIRQGDYNVLNETLLTFEKMTS